MQDKILSIIIPVYNAEKYVEGLLQSFLKQNLEKVEIILVDDGSKDNSLKICNKYADKNESIVVTHQNNQGASAARNTGIGLANGKYIAFVDSDDSIADDYVENVCSICEEQQADLIQFDAYIKKADEVSKREFGLEEGYADLSMYYYHVLNQEVNEPWDKAYKADIIRNNKICFDKKITIGEDISLTLEFLKYAETVYVHHTANYYYARNDEGLCSRAKIKHLDDMEMLYANIKSFESTMNLNEELKYIAQSAMLKGVFRTIGFIIKSGESKNNVAAKMNSLENVNELLQAKYGEKSVELRKRLLCMKTYKLVSFIVAMKNN